MHLSCKNKVSIQTIYYLLHGVSLFIWPCLTFKFQGEAIIFLLQNWCGHGHTGHTIAADPGITVTFQQCCFELGYLGMFQRYDLPL